MTERTPHRLLRLTLLTCLLLWSPSAHSQQSADIPDISITTAIDAALLREERVESHLIDTHTEDGIVTLSGSVDNILARDRAVQLAETIKGVRAIVNRLDVTAVERRDNVILHDVKAALARDPATDAYELTIRVKDAVVTLEGVVDSWSEKQLAAKVAKGIKGVTQLKNNIEIQFKTRRPDSEILPEVKQRLAFDPYVSEELIEVSVNQGKVDLSGTVGSAAERTQAYIDAFVQGVYEVNIADLKVNPRLDNPLVKNKIVDFHTNTQIEEAVKDAFLYDPRVFSFEIDVESVNGKVTLKGTVDNLIAKRAAEQDARHTLGVHDVVNLIKVRPSDMRPDQYLVNEVSAALLADPYVDRFAIKVMARNGKVYLYGDVDTFYQKVRAEELAAGTGGVVAVDNRLDVFTQWDWKSDRQIARDIKDEMFWSMRVDSDDINVDVDEGVATLKGEADSWQELYAAVENAFEGGAKAVRSRIRIENGDNPIHHHRDYHEPELENRWSVGWYTQV